MEIARSTYYRALGGSADDTALVEAMHAIKDEFEAYGWRRMQAALRHRSWVVNHKKIKRLMREHALQRIAVVEADVAVPAADLAVPELDLSPVVGARRD